MYPHILSHESSVQNNFILFLLFYLYFFHADYMLSNNIINAHMTHTHNTKYQIKYYVTIKKSDIHILWDHIKLFSLSLLY